MALAASRALEKIQKGTIAPGYLLLGAELYSRDRICAALRDAAGLAAGSFGLAEFDLRQDSLDKVLEKAQSRNLLAPRQLLFVKNAQGMLSRRGKEADDSGASASKRSGDLADYFRDPNPSSTLVFEMMDMDLDSDDWKEKEKVKSRLEAFDGAFGKSLEVVLLASPGFGEAMELVRAAAAERGRKIQPMAAERLVVAFHRNMAAIRMELEKLCLFDPEKEWIEVEELSRLVTGTADNTNLELADAVGARDAGKVLQILDDLTRSGKYSGLVISEVARYIRQLILIKEGKARDARQAGKILWDAKLPAPQSSLPGMVEKARNFTGTQLLRGLRLAFEADLALRYSPVDNKLVLEHFILQFIGPSRLMRSGAGSRESSLTR